MKKLAIIFCLTLSIQLIASAGFCQQEDSSPVIRLKSLYKSDKDFRKTVDEMFKGVQPLKGGSDNPWKGKSVEDLYDFLNEWFYFLPDAHNGLDRIIQFTFLYYNNPAGKKFILEEPGRSWSLYFVEERGKYMDSPESTRIIGNWLNDPSLGNEDFVNPEDGFNSFNEFFIRDLKPGARQVEGVGDQSALVSPADGIINMINNDLQLESEIPTKSGMTLNLNALLGDSDYAKEFVGGTALAVFLLPHNYHHYHAPVTGTIVESSELVGNKLFGMPDILDMINNGNVAYNKDYSVFQDFKHGYFIIDTKAFGYVAMVPIGLQTVGSVVFEEPFKNISEGNKAEIYKGQRLGHFKYGGSTVLLLFQKDRFSALNVRQGQQIGTLSESQH